MLPRALRGGKRGYILFVSLGFAILLGMGSLLAVSGTVSELQSAGQQVRDKRAFFRADGAASLCLRELRNRLQRDLPARLRTLTSVSNVATYATNNDPAGFLTAYAYQAGASLGGAFQHTSATQAGLTQSYAASATAGRYDCTLSVISRAAPVNLGPPISPAYLFRYRYTIDGTAAEGGLARRVNLQGAFSVQVQQDNFARYALFTNRQQNAAGSTVWFTNRTNFFGPVHTNGEFNFALNPGAAFTAAVTSVSGTSSFYNGGSPVHLDADRNAAVDVPTFGEGLERGVANIPMPSTTTADRQRGAALGLPTGTSGAGQSSGVRLSASGGSLTGGVYVNGDASISLSASGHTATYTITQGSTTTTVSVNTSSNQTTVRSGPGQPTTYDGVPNGMFFVDGQVTSLSGTVQSDSQLTIAATGDVKITNNITYQDYTAGASPSAEGTTNLLGLMSWNGDVRITGSAPNNVSVHATVMTPNGEFRVDNYNSGPTRGTATVLGGVIENTYGAFGTFSGNTPSTGYGRNFIYDTRMGRGMAPPFFPTIGSVISILSGANDRPNWQQTN